MNEISNMFLPNNEILNNKYQIGKRTCEITLKDKISKPTATCNGDLSLNN
jgi:hypothetical protein